MQREIYLKLFLAFLCACAVALAATPLVRRLAFAVGAVDKPGGRHIHKKPTPLLGGLAIFLGFVVSLLIFGTLDRQLGSTLLGALVIVVVSALDDRFDLPPVLRLGVHVIAALSPVLLGGIRVEFLSGLGFGADAEYSLGFLSIPMTVLWIVGVTNAVNWIDGLDGLAAGVSGIAALSMLVISCLLGNFYVALVLAALVGAVVGFLPYNFNPAKIFMGDTGAMFLGYTLAVLSIQGLFKFYVIVSFVVPFLVVGIPILDMAVTVLRRVLHGQSPMAGDRAHVHHRLIDMGFSQRQTVAILYCISFVLGISAVVLTVSGEFKAILLLLAVILAAVFGIVLIARREHSPGDPEHMSESGEERKDPENPEAAQAENAENEGK